MSGGAGGLGNSFSSSFDVEAIVHAFVDGIDRLMTTMQMTFSNDVSPGTPACCSGVPSSTITHQGAAYMPSAGSPLPLPLGRATRASFIEMICFRCVNLATYVK
jgi:hypothetical protein